MIIETIKNSVMNSCTYILCADDTDACLLIDCGEYEPIHAFLSQKNIIVKGVLLTHGHCDHIGGLPSLLMENPEIPIYTTIEGINEIKDSRRNLSFFTGNPIEVKSFNAVEVSEGSDIKFEGFPNIKVLYTPGHDDSELSFCVEDNLFTGDAYIPGLEVLYKYPRGNKQKAFESEARLKEMERKGYNVFCGHHSY